jgi:hypothetical protein
MNKKTILSAALFFAGLGMLSAQHTRTESYVVQDDASKQAYYESLQNTSNLTAEQNALKLQNAQEGSSMWPAAGFTFTGDPVLDMAAYTAAKQDWKARNPNYVPSVGTRTLGDARDVSVRTSTMLNVAR